MTLNSEFLIPSEEGLSTPTSPWPSRLAFDFAMGEDPELLTARYEIGPTQWQYLLLNPAFMLEVEKHRRTIVEEGVTFRLKAKLQAEAYLEEIDTLVHDPETSPAVRLDAIKSMVKWSGYEPTTKDSQAAPSGPTRMVISWADGSGQIALET